MFHVEQKEPGADREPTGSRQGADREPTGSRQGADREPTGSRQGAKEKTRQKEIGQARLVPFFRCLHFRPQQKRGGSFRLSLAGQ
jgi:hypothetical protein